jgi:hypothetical protein
MPLSRYSIAFSVVPDSENNIEILVNARSEVEAIALARKELLEKLTWSTQIIEPTPAQPRVL